MCRRSFLTFFYSLAVVIFLVVPNFAQESTPTYGTKKKQANKGPRAVAVLEWTSKGGRLIPISIMIDDKFYDAGLYMAQPIPMALDTGVVYEIRQAGEPLGDFTLQAAQQTPSGAWVGLGTYDSKADQAKRKEAAAKAVAAAAAAKKEEEKEEHPVLKRGKSTPSPETSAPESKTTSNSSASKPEQKASAPASTPELHETSSDVNRPILKRGKPQQEQAQALVNEATPTKKLTPPPPGLSTVEVAVSDASQDEPHPYKWNWANPGEQQKVRAQAEKMALDALAGYAAKTGGPKPGKLQDIEIQVYDLNYSNSPDIVLSARALPETKPGAGKRSANPLAAPPSDTGLEYYVTIAGREDIYATLQTSFVMTTDNKHLDAFPRMHFIDAVDVDGNGSGELLFRSTTDRSNSFVIYKELGFKLDEVIRVPEPN
ncbi:MAG: hypothetical protein ACXVZV_00140 [Terriglobales bacterium]